MWNKIELSFEVKYLIVISIFFASIFTENNANALEFIVDKNPNSSAYVNYVLTNKDTLGGYALYAAENDWKYYYTHLGYVTCRSTSYLKPYLFFQRFVSGKWVGNYVVSTTFETSGCAGWDGDPCAGDKILKINRLRNGLDRCATSELSTYKLQGSTEDVLRLSFIESNNGGRLYESTFNIHYKNLGIPWASIVDKNSDFNKRLGLWMGNYLDSVVKAAGFDKPQDAFNNLDPLFYVIVKNESEAKPSLAPKTILSESTEVRLQKIKELFDKGLISKADYESKKKEIIDAL
jgi:hypothetical protein